MKIEIRAEIARERNNYIYVAKGYSLWVKRHWYSRWEMFTNNTFYHPKDAMRYLNRNRYRLNKK